MHINDVSWSLAAQTWFRTRVARNAIAATTLIAVLSGGSSIAAQTTRTGVPAFSAPAQSPFLRGPSLQGLDRMSRLIRTYTGRRNVPLDRSPSWVDASRTPAVWFALQGRSKVNSYDDQGHLVASLTGLNAPMGVSVDKSGKVYVSNTAGQQVLIYKKGASVPSLTLDDAGFSPVAVAVNEADGSIAVDNACSFVQKVCSGKGNTLIYQKGATKPSMALTDLTLPEAVAFDASGKLWETGYNSRGPVVGYYRPGDKTFHTFNITLNGPDALQFDRAGNLDIVDSFVSPCPSRPKYSCSILSVYKPGNTVPIKSFVVGVALNDIVTAIALDKDSGTVWAAETLGASYFGFLYDYPSGKFLIRHSIVFSPLDAPYGVAVQP